jgi:tetratricopeptide (TPR) repeat protein
MYVTDNCRVLNPSWANAFAFLREVRKPSTVQGYYQPLTMISLMLDTALGGRPDRLRPYHRTSLALHALNTVLVIVLLYVLLGSVPRGSLSPTPSLRGEVSRESGRAGGSSRIWAAVMVGVLFGLHPMTVETIAWLGERKTVLATFFAIVCMLLYVAYTRRKNRWFYIACLAAFVLALMTKPTVTPLPVLLLLLDYWPLQRLTARTVIEKLPLFLVAGVSAAVTVVSQQHGAIVEHHDFSSPQKALLVCHNIVFYLLKMIWPSPLSVVYPFPEPLTASQPAVLAGVIGTVILAALVALSLRCSRAILVGWLFFLAALAPTLMNVGYSMGVAADKYAYLPSLGLLLCLAWAMGRLWRGSPDAPSASQGEALAPAAAALEREMQAPVSYSARRAVLVMVVTAVAAVEARGTSNYYRTAWKDTPSLCHHILAVAPGTAWAHEQLGYYLLQQNRVEDAIRHCRQAVRLQAGSATARVNLGLALARQGAAEEALAQFEAAVKAAPDSAAAHNALGSALAARGDLGRAIVHFRDALRSSQAFPQAHYNLALALAAQGAFDDAIIQFNDAIRLKPAYPEAHFKLADLLAERGSVDEAIKHYAEALQLRPDDPGALTNLGIELAQTGRIGEAIGHFRRAVAVNPHDPDMHNNLARALTLMGRNDEATHEYREALRIDPGNRTAQRALSATTSPAATPSGPQSHTQRRAPLTDKRPGGWDR